MRSRAEKTRRETCRISFKMNIPKKYLIVDDRKVFCVKSTLDRDDFPWIFPSFPSFLPTMLIEVEGRRSKLFRFSLRKLERESLPPVCVSRTFVYEKGTFLLHKH